MPIIHTLPLKIFNIDQAFDHRVILEGVIWDCYIELVFPYWNYVLNLQIVLWLVWNTRVLASWLRRLFEVKKYITCLICQSIIYELTVSNAYWPFKFFKIKNFTLILHPVLCINYNWWWLRFHLKVKILENWIINRDWEARCSALNWCERTKCSVRANNKYLSGWLVRVYLLLQVVQSVRIHICNWK